MTAPLRRTGADRRDIEAERGASDAGETAAAKSDPSELARLPADEQTAVGDLEIVLVVGEPVGGAPEEERVVEQTSTVHTSQFAGAIVEVGDLEVGRQHPRIMNPFEHERPVGRRCAGGFCAFCAHADDATNSIATNTKSLSRSASSLPRQTDIDRRRFARPDRDV
jgi:hypothetical protein